MDNKWNTAIGGAFGSEDVIFANHPADRKRAASMLADALKSNIGFRDYCDTIKAWLRTRFSSQGINHERVDELVKAQMTKVRDLSSYFPD